MKSTEANSSHLKKRNSSFDMTKKDKKKLRAQVKSRFYYYFWAFMALTVFIGQLYVGYGYRLMHGSMLDLMNKVDGVLLHKGSSSYKNML